jgi:carboxypeptidase T
MDRGTCSAAAVGAIVLVVATAGLASASDGTGRGAPVEELGLFPDDAEPGETSSHSKPGEDLGVYRNYTETRDRLHELADEHPDLVDLEVIGETVEGRELWMATVAEPGAGPHATEVLFDAGHHGNEVISSEVTLRMLEDLVEGYGVNATLTEALEGNVVHVVPQVNPDGTMNVEDCDWYGDCRKNANGVDLNRNYGHHWGERGASDNPDSATYHGPEPFSEPETRAIKSVADDANLAMHFASHSGTELWLWPWGYTQDRPQEVDALSSVGQGFEDRTGFEHGQSSRVLYYSSGNARDWQFGGSAGAHPLTYTPEVYGGDEGGAYDWWPFFNPPEDEIEDVYRNMQDAFLYALDVAGTYTDPVLTAEHGDPTQQGFELTAKLDNQGLRTFEDGVARVDGTSPGLELLRGDPVELGTLETGEAASATWSLTAREAGEHEVALNASSTTIGNWTRNVTVSVPWAASVDAAPASPTPGQPVEVAAAAGAVEHDELSVDWRLAVTGDTATGPYERTLDEGRADLEDEAWRQEATYELATGDLPDGTYTATLAVELQGVRDGQPVADTLTRSATWTVERPQVVVDKVLPAAATPGEPVAATATYANAGSLVAEAVEVEETIPAGYLLAPQAEPTFNPYRTVADPAPERVLVDADGATTLTWRPGELAPGEVFEVAYEVVPLLPGTFEHESSRTYEHGYADERVPFTETTTVEHRVGPAS